MQTYSIAGHGCFSCEADWFRLGLVCLYPLDGLLEEGPELHHMCTRTCNSGKCSVELTVL